MAVKRQFSLRSILAFIAGCAIYFSLGQNYGFGRAIVCLVVVLLGASSWLFVVAAWVAAKEGNWRNCLAAAVIAVLVSVGALLIGRIVFYEPVPVPSAFSLDEFTG